MKRSWRPAAIGALLLAVATTSCGDEQDTRLDGIATDVWLDQVARSVDPEFCNDSDRDEQLPVLLVEQYDVAADDLEAVADLLIIRCEAGG